MPATLRKRPTQLEAVFVLTLFVSQIYYGYRYPLQYSTEGTATYQNTPLIYQAGKYLVVLGALYIDFLFLCISGAKGGLPLSVSGRHFVGIVIAYLTYLLLGTLFTIGNAGLVLEHIFLIKAFFFLPLLLLLPFHYLGETSLTRYGVAIIILGAVYHVIFSVIQIAAFLSFGRLPALGWPGFARFGGGWDDPNSFGLFLILPFLLSFGIKASTTRYTSYAALIALLLLTVSFTGLVGFVSALMLYMLLTRRTKALISLGIVIVALILGLLSIPGVWDFLSFIVESKQASVEAHLTTFSLADLLERESVVESLIGMHDSFYFNESFYLAMFLSYGVVGLGGLLLIIALTLGNAIVKLGIARRDGNSFLSNAFATMGSFIIGFSVASIGIPYFSIFPINLYFWLCVFLVWITPARGGSGGRRSSDVVPHAAAHPSDAIRSCGDRSPATS